MYRTLQHKNLLFKYYTIPHFLVGFTLVSQCQTEYADMRKGTDKGILLCGNVFKFSETYAGAIIFSPIQIFKLNYNGTFTHDAQCDNLMNI